MNEDLYAANHPARFWKLQAPVAGPARWDDAIGRAAAALPFAARADGDGAGRLLDATLGEGLLGPDRFRLSRARRAYYLLKPLLPRSLILRGRRRASARAQRGFPLGWPIEDRYRRFLWDVAAAVLAEHGISEAPFISFWPHGASHALVLTHDVETDDGQRFASRVADLEQGLGLRSSFNFVTERYALDRALIADLVARGFEVGVHGRLHNGRELRSRRAFEGHARHLNRQMRLIGAVGFRSPLTHRHPEWMQALDVEYDASFFDTDPFEPMPGGTMSLWPFTIGRFTELPYTLAQDSTMLDVLGERGPRLWLEKASYLRRHGGMVLLNTHPDYLRERLHRHVYAEFLEAALADDGWWNALPRDAARWWRRRADADAVSSLPGARAGCVRLDAAGEARVAL